MNVGNYIAIAALLLTFFASIYGLMRIVVRSLMSELAPNSGKSMKDQVTRIELRLDQLILEMSKK